MQPHHVVNLGAILAFIPALDALLASTGVVPAGVLTVGTKAVLGIFGTFTTLYGAVKAKQAIDPNS